MDTRGKGGAASSLLTCRVAGEADDSVNPWPQSKGLLDTSWNSKLITHLENPRPREGQGLAQGHTMVEGPGDLHRFPAAIALVDEV